jgi:Flp pilus assembly protein TadD
MELDEKSTSDHQTLEALKEDAKTNPSDVNVLRRLGWAYYGAGEAFEAKGVLSDAISRFPEDLETNYALGIVLKKIGEDDTAIELFQKTMDLAEEKVDPRISMLKHLAQNQILMIERGK